MTGGCRDGTRRAVASRSRGASRHESSNAAGLSRFQSGHYRSLPVLFPLGRGSPTSKAAAALVSTSARGATTTGPGLWGGRGRRVRSVVDCQREAASENPKDDQVGRRGGDGAAGGGVDWMHAVFRELENDHHSREGIHDRTHGLGTWAPVLDQCGLVVLPAPRRESAYSAFGVELRPKQAHLSVEVGLGRGEGWNDCFARHAFVDSAAACGRTNCPRLAHGHPRPPPQSVEPLPEVPLRPHGPRGGGGVSGVW